MKFATTALSFALALLLTSCAGPSFEKEWKAATANFAMDQAAGETKPIVGPWSGMWLTPSNDHTGKLRCLISETEVEGRYAFRYHATWAKIFSGGYRAEFEVTPTGDGYIVEGSKDLGMFGEFDHRGTIDGTEFFSTFEASGYEGTFDLKRP